MRYYAHIICRKLKRQSEAFDSVGYMKNSKQFFLYSSLDINIVNVKLHNIFWYNRIRYTMVGVV